MVWGAPARADTCDHAPRHEVTSGAQDRDRLSAAHQERRREHLGVALALISAAAFGLFAVLLRVADDEGAAPVAVMAARFVIAAPILWAIAVVHRRSAGGGPLLPSRRALVGGVALGFVGYSAQAALFQAAIARTGAAVADMLLYAYPAIVVAVAWAIGREHPTRRRLTALALATVGVVLVISGGGESRFDALGVAMGLGAALAYTLYILGCDGVVRDATPVQLAALVASGAALAFTCAGALGLGGGLDVAGFTPTAWWAVIGVALLGTVLAVSAFLAALELIGPSRSSILSTLEPVVTVVLAYLVLDERLGPVQLTGGALVLGACVLLQLRHRARTM